MIHSTALLLALLAAISNVLAVHKRNVTLGEPPPPAELEDGITLPPAHEPSNFWLAWDHVISHMLYKHRFGRKSVCYDGLGCFHVSGKFSQFRSVPESPERLDTRLYLYTRASLSASFASEEERLRAEELGEKIDPSNVDSLAYSSFDPQRPTKILLHGYNGRGDGNSSILIRTALLKKEDANVISVDWANGARGPNYLRAVANAELVARQLSRLVLNMISLGASARDVHIIGFSLGAQVAGLTGAALRKQGEKLGRITGLDPASFTFEYAGLEADKRLDISDAEFVDVIHTDGSLIWSDGFGLLKPVGHVDFFPNGGQNQPGCEDSYVGALKFQINTRNVPKEANPTTFPQDLTDSGVCSHKRSVDLFIESLEPSCNFVGFPCPGMRSFSRDFVHGHCFSCDGGVCGQLGGHASEASGRGALYLVTRASKPYCGQQLRVQVSLNPDSHLSRGSLVLQLQHGGSVTSFDLSSSRISAQALDMIAGGQEVSAVAAAKPGSVDHDRTPVLLAALTFRPRPGPARLSPQRVILDRVTVTSQEGHWWYYCGHNTTLDYSRWQKSRPLMIQLTNKHC